MVFVGDHGIVNSEPVSLFSQKVTSQMVYSFTQGKTAINLFCKQHNIALKIIDAGVNHDFNNLPDLIDAKIHKGTADFSVAPAMSIDDCKKAMAKGKELVTKQFTEGTNIIGFGDMGIGNTSSASLLMSAFTKLPIKDCIGLGTGLSTDYIRIKSTILTNAQNKHKHITEPLDILATFGSYETAMITGAILQAKALNMTILIDGLVVGAALLAAHAMDDNIVAHCIFTQYTGESTHAAMLKFLNADVLLNLDLKLGEGTGPALAYPLIQSSVLFLNEMASFKDAQVTNTFG